MDAQRYVCFRWSGEIVVRSIVKFIILIFLAWIILWIQWLIPSITKRKNWIFSQFAVNTIFLSLIQLFVSIWKHSRYIFQNIYSTISKQCRCWRSFKFVLAYARNWILFDDNDTNAKYKISWMRQKICLDKKFNAAYLSCVYLSWQPNFIRSICIKRGWNLCNVSWLNI